MARDFRKMIEKGRALIRRRTSLDISVDEVRALGDRMKGGGFTTDATWTGLQEAYYLGLTTGYNAGKRDAAKAAKKED